MSKIVATGSHISLILCTKFDFGRAPPQTSLGELTALPHTSWLDFGVSTFNGREGNREEGG